MMDGTLYPERCCYTCAYSSSNREWLETPYPHFYSPWRGKVVTCYRFGIGHSYAVSICGEYADPDTTSVKPRLDIEQERAA